MSNLGQTTPQQWRLFIALGLPEVLRTALTHEQERLQAAGLHAAWVRPPGMHLTLHFLGDTPVTALERIAAACSLAAARVPSLRLRATGLRCFPSARRPRVLVTNVQGDVQQLQRLHRRLARRLGRLGVRLDSRPYRPHVTIARFRRPLRSAPLTVLQQALAAPPVSYGEFVADAVELFRSELRPGGAVYTSLATAALQGRPSGCASQDDSRDAGPRSAR